MILNKRTREGGISLFLAIVMVALLLLEAALISASKHHDQELRAGRAVDLASDVILASYDQDLAGQYGLLGYREPGLPASIEAYLETELRSYRENFDFTFTSGAPLSETSVLKDQISSYLKLLYPQIMLEKILTKTNLIASFGDQANTASAQGDLIEDMDVMETVSLTDQIQSLVRNRALEEALNSLSDFFAEQDKPNQINIFRNHFLEESLEHDGDDSYEPALNEEDQLLGDELLTNIWQTNESGSQSFSGFAELLNQGIEFLDIPTNHAYERLLTCEYILMMCSNWTDQRSAQTLIDGRENLRGIPLSEINHYRALESEYILHGYTDEIRSKAAVSAMLSASRLTLRVIGLLLNESEMQKLDGWAGILSIGLAVVSGGAVVIESSVLKYILLFLKAQIEAIADIDQLVNGKTVDLLPYVEGGDQSSDYSDYLRLFLLLGDQEEQLSRLAETIDQNLGGPFYTSLETTFLFVHETIPARNFALRRYRSYNDTEGVIDESDE